MKYPDANEKHAPNKHLMHESKTDCHNQGYSGHDSDFGLSGHAPSCHVAFQGYTGYTASFKLSRFDVGSSPLSHIEIYID